MKTAAAPAEMYAYVRRLLLDRCAVVPTTASDGIAVFAAAGVACAAGGPFSDSATAARSGVCAAEGTGMGGGGARPAVTAGTPPETGGV